MYLVGWGGVVGSMGGDGGKGGGWGYTPPGAPTQRPPARCPAMPPRVRGGEHLQGQGEGSCQPGLMPHQPTSHRPLQGTPLQQPTSHHPATHPCGTASNTLLPAVPAPQ